MLLLCLSWRDNFTYLMGPWSSSLPPSPPSPSHPPSPEIASELFVWQTENNIFVSESRSGLASLPRKKWFKSPASYEIIIMQTLQLNLLP